MRHSDGDEFVTKAVRFGLLALALFALPTLLSAQDMPDPSLIHGRAIPASDMPVSAR